MIRPESMPDYGVKLRTLPEELRNALEISIGTSSLVLSRYGDPVWDFSPGIYPRNKHTAAKRLDFSSLLFDDDSRLTDPCHAGLMAGVKAIF